MTRTDLAGLVYRACYALSRRGEEAALGRIRAWLTAQLADERNEPLVELVCRGVLDACAAPTEGDRQEWLALIERSVGIGPGEEPTHVQ